MLAFVAIVLFILGIATDVGLFGWVLAIIVGGANTATVQVALPSSGMYGHSNYVKVTVTGAVPGAPLPVGAVFTFTGSSAQVQLAP